MNLLIKLIPNGEIYPLTGNNRFFTAFRMTEKRWNQRIILMKPTLETDEVTLWNEKDFV